MTAPLIGKIPAFFGCTDLKEISIPKSVTNIENVAFTHCSKLENIIIDSEDKKYASVDGVLYNKDCKELIFCPYGRRFLEIPDGVEKIGNDAFRSCNNLESVKLPDSINIIGAYAFDYCTSLTSIKIPDGVNIIGAGAFSVCTKYPLNPPA